MKQAMTGRSLVVLLFTFVLLQCADQDPVRNNNRDERSQFESVYTQAEASRQAAAEAGNEWLKTRELLEQARLAADKEEWAAATQLANQADEQGRNALLQARHEAEAWRSRVIR
jgi:hypothetical protein